MLNKTWICLLIAVVMISGEACSPKSSPANKSSTPVVDSPAEQDGQLDRHDGGTSDPGGGGNILFSTEDQVKAAVERAKAYLTGAKGKIYLTVHILKAIPADGGTSSETLKEALAKIADGDLAEKLSRSQIEFKIDDTEEKNCAPSDYDRYPDAYVSERQLGANICFNVQRLRRLTPDALFRNLIALWLHEAAHLHGYKEPVSLALGELSRQTAIRLESFSAKPTLEVMESQQAMGLQTIGLLRKGLLPYKEGLEKLRSQVTALGGFDGFLSGLDEAFALDDAAPVLESKVQAFKKDVEGLKAVINGLIDQEKAGAQVSPEAAGAELDHGMTCLGKNLLSIMDDLKYEHMIRMHAFGAAPSEMDNYQSAVCE